MFKQKSSLQPCRNHTHRLEITPGKQPERQ